MTKFTKTFLCGLAVFAFWALLGLSIIAGDMP